MDGTIGVEDRGRRDIMSKDKPKRWESIRGGAPLGRQRQVVSRCLSHACKAIECKPGETGPDQANRPSIYLSDFIPTLIIIHNSIQYIFKLTITYKLASNLRYHLRRLCILFITARAGFRIYGPLGWTCGAGPTGENIFFFHQ